MPVPVPSRAVKARREGALAVLAAVTLALGGASQSDAQASASPGDLVVNEIDYDQPSVDDAEFIEIKNTTLAPIFLGHFDVLGINGLNAPGTEYMRIELPGVNLGPGEYFVIGAASVANVDLVITASSFIQNGAPDAIAIVESDPSDPVNDYLIDSVSYEGDTAGGPINGGSWTEGSGVGLDDSSTIANVGISRVPDGIDTDVNNLDLSRRCITPGEPNTTADFECLPPSSGDPTPVVSEPTATATASATPGGPTATPDDPTATPDDPTATPDSATATPEGPTATPDDDPTATPEDPTATPDGPTATPDDPTATPVSPTATPDGPTATPQDPTATPISGPSPTDSPATSTPGAATPTPTPLDGSLPPLETATPDGGYMAVELDDFRASRVAGLTVLAWQTRTEIDHAGFHLYRVAARERSRLTEQLIPGRGGPFRGAIYGYVDREPPDDKTAYWLADVDVDGLITLHGPAIVPPRPSGAAPEPVPVGEPRAGTPYGRGMPE